jgi:GT2 family glycosyltransferase
MAEHPGEVIVVDGMSTDATRTILRRYHVRVISDSSCSKGAARQLGVEAANRAYVMFVDSDVELTSGSIERMKSEIYRFGWAGITCRIASKDNSTYWQRAENECVSELYFNRPSPSQIRDGRWPADIPTTATLFRRALLLKHPFDPNLVDACEDLDVCWRLRENGFTLGVSTAIAYHCLRPSFRAFFNQRFGYGKGQACVAFKHGFILMLVLPLPIMCVKMLKCAIAGKINLMPYWFALGLAEFLGIVVSSGQRNLWQVMQKGC